MIGIEQKERVMLQIRKALIFIILVLLPLPSIANDSMVNVKKKPAGLRKANPYKSDAEMTAKDRLLWKSVLHWCDECDERAQRYTEDGSGRVFVYPLSDTEYIVEVDCMLTMQQYEALFYKVKEHNDTIESQLLQLEQYEFIELEDVGDTIGKKSKRSKSERDEGGEFIMFKDALTLGLPGFDQKKNRLSIERRFVGIGGCGFMTTYDVSGDRPKVVEFRANTNCSSKYVPPGKWKLYPAKQRAKWRVAPNPQREDWHNKDQCR
jgi:hypothetical protein